MVVETQPAVAFIVAQSEVLLEILVGALDAPALFASNTVRSSGTASGKVGSQYFIDSRFSCAG